MGSVVTAEDLMRKFRIIEESCNFALMSDAWPFRLLRLKFSLQILLCICYDITLEWLEYNSKCSAPNPIRQEFNLSKGDFADWQVNFRCSSTSNKWLPNPSTPTKSNPQSIWQENSKRQTLSWFTSSKVNKFWLSTINDLFYAYNQVLKENW